LRSARELALTLLREAGDAGRVRDASVANRELGLIAYAHGEFAEARTHYERALDARDPPPDSKAREHFGDRGTSAASQFALTIWALGEVGRARELINSATQRALEIGHIRAIVDALFYKSYLEVWRGDPLATLSAAEALERVAREHGIVQYQNEAKLHSGWARGRIDDPLTGAAEVRRVLAALVDQGVRLNLGFYTGLLAELEAETMGADSALELVDDAFRLSHQVEHRCSLPFLHRLRGEILLKRDLPDTALAEEAFVASIDIAKQQGARSPVLLASLSLAKLYQSSSRPADAQAILAHALEGFAPTPEMPEIAEAQALLTALEETDEVKFAANSRRRRAQLQTSYSKALARSRGFAAEETMAAAASARRLAAEVKDPAARFAIYRAQCLSSFMSGQIGSARLTAETYLADAKIAGALPDIASSSCMIAHARMYQGGFADARKYLDEGLETYIRRLERSKPQWVDLRNCHSRFSVLAIG
jgi:predicted ATPase